MAKVDHSSRGFERERKDRRDHEHREDSGRDGYQDNSKDQRDS